MNELTTNNYTLESREVAVMVEKEHKNLLADIRGYITHMQNSTELKFQPSDFFISSSYKDATLQVSVNTKNFLHDKRAQTKG